MMARARRFPVRGLETLLLAAGALVLAPSASAQPTGYRTAMDFLDQARGIASGESIAGPPEAYIRRSSQAAETVPIARVAGILSGCRHGSSMYGGSEDRPGKSVGTRYFECLAPGAFARTLKVVVVLSPDERSVEALDLYPGVEIYWTPPSPSPPGWKQPYDSAKLPAYQAAAKALLGSIAQAGGAVKIELANYQLGRPDSITPSRAAEILKPCVADFTPMAAVPQDGGKPPLDAVIVYMKCQPGSSAPEDLQVWVAFADAKPVSVQIQAAQDYQIPPPAAGAEKQ